MQFKFDRLKKVCLNLKRNVYRRDQVENEFLKHAICKVEFLTAVDKFDIVVPELSVKLQTNPETAAGITACAMSHMNAIQYAKDNKWPAVCIFEDDVIFCDDFRAKLKHIESLENFDFDIFCLGGHFTNPDSIDQDSESTQWLSVRKVKTMGGTYAYILAENTYDFILRNHNYNFGADEYFSNFVYKNFRTYALVPFLAGCLPSKSDVTGGDGNIPNVGWYFDIKNTLPGKEIETTLDLKDTTFIIPVRIESPDRAFNFLRVMQYLCDNLETNIIVYESGINSPVLELMKRIDKQKCKVEHIYEYCEDDFFHRTKFLNIMLSKVTTPVTVNYDIDIMLRLETYRLARNRITKGEYDLIYPFGKGIQQVKVTYSGVKLDFNGKSEDLFHPQYHSEWSSLAGFVQFFNTESYRKGYMENEAFISYGAEDRERLDRFEKLGFKVDWCEGLQVFHLDHERGINSNANNPFFARNEGLYYQLKGMSRDELVAYYEAQEWLKKYSR